MIEMNHNGESGWGAESLSDEGRSRRTDMLNALQVELALLQRHRRRHRVIARSIGGVVMVIALAALGVWLTSPGAPTNPGGQGAVADADQRHISDDDLRKAPVAASSVVVVSTDSTTLERYAALEESDVSRYMIDDEQLIETLAQLGRRTGLVRSQGRTWLTAAVTDAAIRRESAPDGQPGEG